MLKKIVLGCTLAIASTVSYAACNITYFGGDAVDKAMKTGFKIKNYATVCNKLQAANVGISLYLSSGVLAGRSIASATAILRSMEVPSIISFSTVGLSTYADEAASTPTVERLATAAIMDAIDYLEIDQGIADINEKRKAFYKK